MSERSVPYPHPWPESKFAEVGSVTVGGTPSTGVPEYWGGDIPWMASGDVHGRVIDDVPMSVSSIGLRHSSATIVDPPSVAVALAGQGRTRGTAAYVRCALCTNQSIALLKTRAGKLDAEYLLHNLNFRYSELRSRSAGGGRAGLTKTILEDLPLPVPTLREQAKIAEVLSTVDRAIEQTEALIAKQQRIKTGLMQDLLTRGIDEHGNLRSELSHEFRDSPIGRIPVDWTVSSVGAEFEIQLGKMLSQESRLSRSPRPYLGNKNVQWDRVDLTNLERMDFDKGEREKFRLKPDDILVCEGGEVGRTCLWREEIEECFYQKAIHRLRPKRDYLPSLFPTYMKWAVRNGLLSDFTSQSSIAHLTKEKLEGVPIQVPPISEQVRISETIEALDRQIANHVQQLAKLISLKDGLMQDLLTGNRRVTALLEQSGWGSE